MIKILFYNTLLTGSIISILVIAILLASPELNRRYQITWRFNIWKAFSVFLILPIGAILRLVINSEKAQSSITTIKNSIAVNPISSEAINFQMIAENQHVSMWTKLISVGPQWISVIWVVGAIVVMIYLISTYMHFTRGIKKSSIKIENECIDKIQAVVLEKYKGKKNISVYQCSKIPSPMIIGICKPAIFIPQRKYTNLDLEIILTHELTHYIRKDLIFKLMLVVAMILHWYNPIVHMMAKVAGRDLEMCCDQDSIKGKGKVFKQEYTDVIMSEIISQRQIKGTLLACMGGDKKTMEERFKNIFNKKKRKGGMIFVAVLIVAIVFSAFTYANDHKVPDFNSPEYQTLLNNTVDDKIASRKDRREELGKFNNRVYADIPNYNELANQVMDKDGEYDELDIYKLAGVEPPNYEEELKYLEKLMSTKHTTVNNTIEPHILGNGERANYFTKAGEPWELKKGEKVKLHIFADINRLGAVDVDPMSGMTIASKGVLRFGYTKDDKNIDVEEFKIENEKELEFKIPENGAYTFYLFCPGSLDILIQWVSIDVK